MSKREIHSARETSTLSLIQLAREQQLTAMLTRSLHDLEAEMDQAGFQMPPSTEVLVHVEVQAIVIQS